jgi:hypothetical protein
MEEPHIPADASREMNTKKIIPYSAQEIIQDEEKYGAR